MKADIRDRWVAALRSGRYEQGRGQLVAHRGRRYRRQFCCLGVLTDLAVQDRVVTWRALWARGDQVLPPEVREWAGLPNTDPQLVAPDGRFDTASELNDSVELTFAEIADRIEATFPED